MEQAFLRIFAKKYEMAIPSFFKQNKPRGFNYKPRYYDPVKEEWDERRRARSMEHGAGSMEPSSAKGTEDGAGSMEHGTQGSEKQIYRSRIMRGSMRGRFARSRDRIKQQSMIRLIVILLIIALIIYIYLRF